MINDKFRANVSQQPRVADSAWIAPGAVVIGQAVIGDKATVWFQSVIRADGDRITVGAHSNVQDGAVLHADDGFPCEIGERVTIGHRAVVHGATVGNGALIGMGAIVMNGAIIGEESLIAAGAVVKEHAVVEPRTLWAGIPAKKVRELPEAAVVKLSSAWEHYVDAGEVYADLMKDVEPES